MIASAEQHETRCRAVAMVVIISRRAMKYRLDRLRLSRLAALALAGGLFVAISAREPGPAWPQKVHPLVLQSAAEGPVEFMLVLADQRRPLPPAGARSRNERARAVFDQLREHAARTQAPLIRLLDRLGVEYRSYWLANLIWVRGDGDALEQLARRPEVLRVDANPQVRVELPRPGADSTAAKATAAIEWTPATSGIIRR
jgi:hypothetical protein